MAYVYTFVACEGSIHTCVANETLPWEVVDELFTIIASLRYFIILIESQKVFIMISYHWKNVLTTHKQVKVVLYIKA